MNLALKVSDATTMQVAATNDFSPLSNDFTDTVSFTPTSFKIPIMKISLFKADSTNEQVIYTCPHAAEADCFVDLTSQTELNAIVTASAGAQVDTDTYTYVSIATCAAGSNGTTATTAKITGSASTAIGGSTYRTSAGASIAVGSGTEEEAVVGNWSCSAKIVKLNPAITITAGSAPTLTIAVDNTYLGYFSTQVSSGMGGCKVNGTSNSGIGLCVNYPALLGYVGEGTPTIKRFKIAHAKASAAALVSAKANAILMVALDSSGKPLSAFGRPYFGSASASPGRSVRDSTNGSYDVLDPAYAGPGWGNGLDMDSFSVSADNKVTFKLGGSLDSKGAFMSNFAVTSATTEGTLRTSDEVDTWFYRAIPLN